VEEREKEGRIMMSAAVIERDYMGEQRRAIYIALEELDFIWDQEDVKAFETMWDLGWDCGRIAAELGRDPDEVAILVIDRARAGKIERRPGGWFGTKR